MNAILEDIPVPITTPRLLLRPPKAGDGAAISEAKRESWSELQKWMPWAKGEIDEVQDEILARQNHAKFITREDLMLLAFDKNNPERLIGSTGLHRMDWNLRIFEIGYWIRSSETGKGYASEIATSLTLYAFNALKASKVKINAAQGNAASQRVIEKCGFVKEAVLKKDDTLPNGQVVDTYCYARFDTKGLKGMSVAW